MLKRLHISLNLFGLLLAFSQASFAGEAPDESIISHTETGKVIHRTLSPNGEVANRLPYAEGEILVRFKDSALPSRRATVHGRIGAVTVKRYSVVKNLERVKIPVGISIEQAVESYQNHPDVLYAEPNYVVEALGIPNDPSFPSQWNLHNTAQNGGTLGADIKAAEAWNLTTGSNDVVVAVIDTGVDYNHEDLAANIWKNEADCNNNGIDDDGNGYVDDCYGIDTFNDDSDPMDDNNHGTHVAGIIGAVGNNTIGVVGVNWNVKIMPCKFIDSQGFGYISDAVACFEYVQMMKDRGVNVVATSNSWAGYFPSRALFEAADAHRQRGILLIAAAGNTGRDSDISPLYPAGYYLPNVVSVAATDQFDNFAGFSSRGNATVHLGAPGWDITSTTVGNTYANFSGTSMAAPHVSGIAALLKAQNPARDWKEIKNLILAGGDSKASLADTTVTGKRASAYGSLICSNAVVLARLWPREKTLTSGLGPVNLSALHINCGNPNGNVTASVNPGNKTVVLRDDGIEPDQVAGDGIYSGQWTPPSAGTFTITFPDGDLVTVVVDSDLKPGFPVKTFSDSGSYQGGPVNHALIGNIDDDPQLEIVASGFANGPLYAWKYDGSRVPGWPVSDSYGVSYPALGELSTVFPGQEIISAYDASALVAYSGRGETLAGWPLGSRNFNSSPASLADVDGDGIDEVFIGGEDGQVHAYRADGSTLPGWPPAFGHLGGQVRWTPAIADLDGDGIPEIVTTSGRTTDGVYLFAYHADGTSLQGFPIRLPCEEVETFPAIGDVDGDGFLEIVVVGFVDYHKAAVIIVGHDGTIKRQILIAGFPGYGTAPALADLDGDGLPEIIVQTDEALNVLRGDGSTFPGWPVVWGGYWIGNSAPVVGDVDGDGLPDIVVYTQFAGIGVGELRVYNRNGVLHPRFPKRLNIASGSVPAIADLDLDGRNEIAVVGSCSLVGVPGECDSVWVYDLGGPPHGAIQWGQFMGGSKHQGYYQGGFSLPRRSILSVTIKGSGTGTVTGSGINCGTDCVETYPSGTVVTLMAQGSNFTGWKGAGCSGTGKCTVKMDSDTKVTAVFGKLVTLNVSTIGSGQGEVMGLGIYCGTDTGTDCSEDFNPGARVSLSAISRWGSRLAGWAGECDSRVVFGMDGDCLKFEMNSDMSITAVFGTPFVPTLIVSKSGTGAGRITSNPPGINCGEDCANDYSSGTTITLTAIFDTNTIFNGWSGACTGTGACVVSMTPLPRTIDKSVSANFTKILDLASPSAGEVVAKGRTVNIQWSTIPTVNIPRVKVELSLDGGKTWKTLVKQMINTGFKSSKLKAQPTNQAKIRVCSVGFPAICDTSDAFVIR